MKPTDLAGDVTTTHPVQELPPCCPPPEHDDKALHWVECPFPGDPTVGYWRVAAGGTWDWSFVDGALEKCTAADAGKAGYRYLGPAHYVEPGTMTLLDVVRSGLMSENAVYALSSTAKYWKSIYEPIVNDQKAQIAELTDEVAKLKYTGAGAECVRKLRQQLARSAEVRQELLDVCFTAWAEVASRDACIADPAGNHDYIGPASRGKSGNPPDPVHEQFHRAVGDVLAGRVIPEARRQMEEALKNAPKEPVSAPGAILRGNKANVGLISGSYPCTRRQQ